MASDFEWRTEEETWSEQPQFEPAGSNRPGQRPLLSLFFLGIIAIATVAGYRMLDERAAAGILEAEERLIATQHTLQRAAANADAELAARILSGRNHAWSAAQQEVIGAGLFYDRTAWNLQQVSDPVIENFSIQPTLLSAVVTTTQTLTTGDSGGAPFTVHRRQLYRRGETAWLLSPPRDDGVVWTQNSGTFFIISYRNRDATVGAPLAAELESRLWTLCELGAIPCTNESPSFIIRLTDHPRALLSSATPVPTVQRANFAATPTLELPSPDLLGQPVDDRGAAILSEIYTRIVIRALLADSVGYRCCDRLQLHLAFLAFQQAAIGLDPLPQPNLYPPESLEDLAEIWNATTTWDNEGTAVTLLDFLGRETGLSVAELHRTLATTRQRSLAGWIAELLPEVPADLHNQLWHSYLIQRRFAAKSTDPPLPDQRLVGLCPTPSGAGIFYLDPTQLETNRVDEWWAQSILLDRRDLTLSAIGRGELLLLQEATTANLRSSILLLEGTHPTRLSLNAFGYSAPMLSGDSDPSARYLPGFISGPEGDTPGNILLDRQRCATDDCPLLEIDGQPIWSPNGRRTVLMVRNNSANRNDPIFEYALHLAGPTGQGPVLFDYGYSPDWLDSGTVVFVDRSLDEIENSVRVYHVGEQETEILADMANFLLQLPKERRVNDAGRPYVIDNLFVNPADRQQIYVVIRQQRGFPGTHLFLFRDGTVSYVAPMPSVPDRNDVRFSPDGRRVAIALSDSRNAGGNLLFLYDLYHDQHEILLGGVNRDGQHRPAIAWSDDAQWLAVATSRGTTLVAPAFDHIVTVPDNLICDTIFWTNNR